MKTIKIYKVEIQWRDSCQESKPWHWIDEYFELEKKSKETFKSIGYLIKKDKKNITLSHSLHYSKDGNLEKIGGIFTIPTGAIIKITTLNL